MKNFKRILSCLCFMFTFMFFGCDLLSDDLNETEMYSKFKTIYENQNFYGGSYTDKYIVEKNTSGVLDEYIKEISYNSATKEGYSKTKEDDKLISEHIIKKDGIYLNYYSSKILQEEYNAIFEVGDTYFKDNLEDIKSKKYLEIKNPNKYRSLKNYSIDLVGELLEIFVDEEGTLEVGKYEIVEKDAMYNLSISFKSTTNVMELEKYKGKEIEVKGNINFVYDDSLIKDYEITFEEIEYSDNTRTEIENSLKYTIVYSSSFNLLENEYNEEEFTREYLINKNIVGNGNIEVKPRAVPNEIINVTITPSNGYMLKDIYYIKEGEMEKHYFTETFIMPDSNITIYASFIENSEKYWVFVKEASGGTIGIVDYKYKPGATINVNPTPLYNYTFKEAYYVKEGTTDKISFTNSFTMPSYNIELYVIFEEKERYTITEAECENGYIEVNGLEDRYVGDTIQITASYHSGYEVDKTYYIKEGEVEKHYFTETFIMPNCNITVYATFKLVSTPVLYELNIEEVIGGYLTTSGYPYVGNAITVTSHPFSNYALKETYYLIEGNNEKFIFENTFIMPAGNVTLYAIYEEYYTIEIYEQSGVNVEVSKEIAFEGEVIEINASEINLNQRIIEVYYCELYHCDIDNKVIVNESEFVMPDYNIIIKVVTEIVYQIEVNSLVNGSVEVKNKAIEGENVEVNVICDNDYMLDEMYYIERGSADKIYFTESFVMPGEKVTIYATFKLMINDSEEFIEVFSDSTNWDGNYILMNNIDLNGVSFSPIGNAITTFTGKFDGNGYVINNVNNIQPHKGNDYWLFGVFGFVEYATIKNVGVSNYNYNLTSFDKTLYVGALIAAAEYSEIENCYTERGKIDIEDTTAVKGGTYKDLTGGGLIGYIIETTVTNCYAQGVNNNYIKLKASNGEVYAGGLIGGAWQRYNGIYNSYASIEVIAVCSDVSGYDGYAGGLVGQIIGTSISESYAINKVSITSKNENNQIYVGGLIAHDSQSGNPQGYRLSSQVISATQTNNLVVNNAGEELNEEDLILKIKESWNGEIFELSNNNLYPTLKIFNK